MNFLGLIYIYIFFDTYFSTVDCYTYVGGTYIFAVAPFTCVCVCMCVCLCVCEHVCD